VKRSILFLIPLLTLILAACSGTDVQTPVSKPASTENASQNQTSSLEREDNQGAVVVTVTPINLDNPGETIDFRVTMETHSVELDMDLPSLSTLKTDTGITLKGANWDGSVGGHHVEGTLSFPASQDGKPVVQGAKELTLLIQNIVAPERNFTWELTE